ncbi:MAG: hypothetical protein ACI9BW_000739 [Gammaproteobacteria bacterium]|jgi:hypothetical protein
MKKTEHGGGAMRRTRRQWSALIEQYAQSAQTQTAFCASRGLPISSFTSALRRARESGEDITNANAFVPVLVDSMVQSTPPSAWDVELTLGAGIVLRIRASDVDSRRCVEGVAVSSRDGYA